MAELLAAGVQPADGTQSAADDTLPDDRQDGLILLTSTV
jgi:hypothetical protein